MKHRNTIVILACAAAAYLAGTAWASPELRRLWQHDDTDTTLVAVESVVPDTLAEPDSVYPDELVRRYLPGEIRDTVVFNEQQQAKDRLLYHSQIKVLARTYGDSVVLRWSASDYVTWRYLNHVGVNVLRMTDESVDIDTLALAFKPLPLEDLQRMYSDDDSIAQMGYGAVYNLETPNPYGQRDEAGSMGALFDVYQDQQLQLGVAILASEWRPDVANSIAMRWVDRTAKLGKTYTYSIVPAEYDTTMTIMLDAGVLDDVKNVPAKPAPFDVQCGDSISPPKTVQIWWENRPDYSSYEIERRRKGESRWTRLNQRPYLVMLPDLGGENCFYSDNVPTPGTYEYRVWAHDPFGELTEPSRTITVHVGDMIPPRAPEITWIEIDRPREDAPADEVWAEIHFEKDTMELDYAGCVPMYFHERATNGEWRPLLDKPLSPTDTVCRIDVTNLVTGNVCIAAYDTAQNVSYSIPQLLRISDMRPPLPPAGLRAETNANEGTITLTWNALDDADDVDYYEIVFANDTTHQFMTQRHGQTRDTTWTDTVSMEANQKYIYYKVRAIDYSQNIGEFTPVLQVVRPSYVPPSVAHLDSAAVNGEGVFMRWICGDDEQLAYHHVLRRLESKDEWTLLRRCDADSVKALEDVLELFDTPDVSATEQWVYAVESFNYSDVSSGLSLQFMASFDGERLFTWPIRLSGTYREEDGETRLAWEMDADPPYSGEWYFCIYRKGPGDDLPQFLLSAEPSDRFFNDFLLQPGETAEYYIFIQYPDGRASEPSNTISVTAPLPKE